jgi:hypothetical protein
MLTIPTFRPGQRVRLHYHPYEDKCPNCGTGMGTSEKPFEEITQLISQTKHIICCNCNSSIPIDDGFWVTTHPHKKGFGILAVPYTLIEPLESPEED